MLTMWLIASPNLLLALDTQPFGSLNPRTLFHLCLYVFDHLMKDPGRQRTGRIQETSAAGSLEFGIIEEWRFTPCGKSMANNLQSMANNLLLQSSGWLAQVQKLMYYSL